MKPLDQEKMVKMKKVFLLFVAVVGFAISVKAQTWDGVVSHNGYSCYTLKNSNNITVYAARGVESNMGEALFVKIRVPYNWGNTSTGCVNVFAENLVTGAINSQSSYFHYYNGWLYFTEYLFEWCSGDVRRGSCPCNNYTITIYEKNDHGREVGNKIVVNMCFDRLNAVTMPMNKVSFETYW